MSVEPVRNAPGEGITGKESEEDFYMENGFVIFTAAFLRRRGYCCGNGCRHCPYPKEDREAAD